MEEIVQIFKALSDETRLKILIMVSKRCICAKGIAKHLGITEAAVSQHLKLLKEAGIIASEKSGYYVKYTLQEQSLRKITDFIDHIKDEDFPGSCRFDMQFPGACSAGCKGGRNRCCQHNNTDDLKGD